MITHYHYKYTLNVPGPGNEISHFILEVSDLFSEEDFWNETGPFGPAGIGDFNQGNGNPDIPGEIHGLKFDELWGTTAVIEFDSSRMPVWGDFYAKDGGNPTNQAWNEGFARPDPPDPADDGSIDNHILVPDSHVPEPATLALVVLGGLMIARRRTRRWRSVNG